MKEYERHPLSAACGEMDPDEFIALQESVGRRGPTRKIILFEDKILDGWHLYKAAAGMEVEVAFETFFGDANAAEEFVWDIHGARRNWSKSQRATVKAVLLAQKAALGAGSKETLTDAAHETNVSQRTMEQAAAVVRRATPDVIKALVDGDVSLKRAEQISTLPKKEQDKAMREPPAPRGSPMTTKPGSTWRAAQTVKGASRGPVPPQVGVSRDKYAEIEERCQILNEENDRLTARMAASFMEGTEEERAAASTLIAELQAEVKQLTIELDAVKASRDSAVSECNELKRQCAMYRNQLARKPK
jgi:uncharacterized small protein (DUF1192 family)